MSLMTSEFMSILIRINYYDLSQDKPDDYLTYVRNVDFVHPFEVREFNFLLIF